MPKYEITLIRDNNIVSLLAKDKKTKKTWCVWEYDMIDENELATALQHAVLAAKAVHETGQIDMFDMEPIPVSEADYADFPDNPPAYVLSQVVKHSKTDAQ